MNEFPPRTTSVTPISSASERGTNGVHNVKPVASAQILSDHQAQRDPQLAARAEAVASYARLQADIADAIARLDPPSASHAELVGEVDQHLQSLIPRPSVVLPLLPTDPQIVEFVAQVAQSVAQQAALARAAQAHVSHDLADAIAHQ